MTEEMKVRVHAAFLRRKLQGRCPQYILESFSDEALVQKYAEHEAAQNAYSAQATRVVPLAERLAKEEIVVELR